MPAVAITVVVQRSVVEITDISTVSFANRLTVVQFWFPGLSERRSSIESMFEVK